MYVELEDCNYVPAIEDHNWNKYKIMNTFLELIVKNRITILSSYLFNEEDNNNEREKLNKTSLLF